MKAVVVYNAFALVCATQMAFSPSLLTSPPSNLKVATVSSPLAHDFLINSSVSIPPSSISNDGFKCGICRRSFMLRHVYTQHMRTHTGEKPFKCVHCNQGFAQTATLSRHLFTHNQDPNTSIACKSCRRTFRLKSSLSRHMDLVHSKTAELECKERSCGRKFTTERRLEDHMRIVHLRPRPVCNFCDREFTNKASLNSHLLTHMNLRPFVCKVCNSSFTRIATLRIHMRKHTGSKPYSCSFCQRNFSTMSNMQTHKKRHDGGYRYKCPNCDSRFLYFAQYEGHKQYGCLQTRRPLKFERRSIHGRRPFDTLQLLNKGLSRKRSGKGIVITLPKLRTRNSFMKKNGFIPALGRPPRAAIARS